MRFGFVLLRLIAYLAVFFILAFHQHFALWQWMLLAICTAWSVSEHLKRTSDASQKLRIGVWTELGLIVLCSIALHSNLPLFLALSPIVRSDVHLLCKDAGLLGGVTGVAILVEAFTMPMGAWVPWTQVVVIGGLGLHGLFLGNLLRDRDKLARLERIALQAQNLRHRDDERIRIAGQLHDSMGQAWTGVIRGLDAAMCMTGESQQVLLKKIQDTAKRGLTDMRSAVHGWHEGRRSCDEWMVDIQTIAQQWQAVAGIAVHCHVASVPWARFANPEATAQGITRMVMEALTNAIRHADPVQIDVAVRVVDGGVAADVRDVCRTRTLPQFPPDAHGLGLRNMAQRAKDIGGELLRETNDTGTLVHLWVPFFKQEQIVHAVRGAGDAG